MFDPILAFVFDFKLVNLDTEHFKRAVKENVGEYTFQEAFDKTGIYVYLCVYMYLCLLCLCICIWVYMSMSILVYIHIYIYLHSDINMYQQVGLSTLQWHLVIIMIPLDC
jgi:hypothetical protein